jgi:hypothetical protein
VESIGGRTLNRSRNNWISKYPFKNDNKLNLIQLLNLLQNSFKFGLPPPRNIIKRMLIRE